MYSLEKKYKFQLSNGINYTGEVIEEDSTNIKIKTIKDEVLILSKAEIRQALVISDGQ